MHTDTATPDGDFSVEWALLDSVLGTGEWHRQNQNKICRIYDSMKIACPVRVRVPTKGEWIIASPCEESIDWSNGYSFVKLIKLARNKMYFTECDNEPIGARERIYGGKP